METSSLELVSALIEDSVSEKRLEISTKQIQIDSVLGGYGVFIRVNAVEFRRILSNLMNNGIEAIGERGTIRVSTDTDEDTVLIRVADEGKGIPAEILGRLKERGFTFGKASGNGLGLSHAYSSLESWGGELEIESEQGRGTMVIMKIPRAEPPSHFVPQIEIGSAQKVAILDDDEAIHHVWDSRLEKNLVHHFFSASDLADWFVKLESDQARKRVLFLVDYELRGESRNGLDIIKELGVTQQAVLVTSRYDDKNLRKNCENLGVRMIPKSLAGFVPVIIRS